MSLIRRIIALLTDSSPGAQEKIVQITRIAFGGEAPGVIDALLTRFESAGSMFDDIDPALNDENFPATEAPTLDGARLDTLVGPLEDVLERMSRHGRRPATLAELFLYGLRFPRDQEMWWIWSLAKADRSGGFDRYPVLRKDEGSRRRIVDLNVPVNGISEMERVLTFPITRPSPPTT